MQNQDREVIFDNLIKTLELPDSAYELAKKRYEAIGEFFGREESVLSKFDPHVYVQGSFRLGTAIRPLLAHEKYDLDLTCKLRNGFTKSGNTQEHLKTIIGDEVEKYRQQKRIQDEKEEKRRCWRLNYQDELSFHMDIVPSIPSIQEKRDSLFESMRRDGANEVLARDVTSMSVDITDNTLDNYRQISPDWNVSNPEGYAKWFESRMVANIRRDMVEAAQVDDLPIYKRKTPLQRAVQILKRHRDVRYKNDPEKLKPISVIITTLAARSYNGEQNLQEALVAIVRNMERHVQSRGIRVPNPVNAQEDFADKWTDDPRLEQNFTAWMQQLKVDISTLCENRDASVIVRRMDNSFQMRLDEGLISNLPSVQQKETQHAPPRVIASVSPKPWASI